MKKTLWPCSQWRGGSRLINEQKQNNRTFSTGSLLVLLCLAGCSNDGIYRDIQGVVKSESPTTMTIPANPTPTITILGRGSDEFKAEYVTSSLGSPVANFIIRNVPSKQPVVFQLTSSSFDPIITFPFDLATTPIITIPALEEGTTAIIITQIEAISGQTVTTTAGMILGQLKSTGSAAGSCSPLHQVVIKDKETNATATVVGPYYFNSLGNVVNSGHFSDTQCNYVMANVLPGNYTLQFLDTSLIKQKEHEVVVLPGKLVFGMDVPE